MDATKGKDTRLSKRDVIVIDGGESTSDQPVVKSAKRDEEPEAASKIAELQQEVDKLKGSFKRACRAAREAELRTEFLENLLDSKRGVKDGAEKEKVEELEKKLTDALNKLEGAMRREEKAYCNNRELARENEALKTTVADMMRGEKDRVNKLMVIEREKANENRRIYQARIDQLMRRIDNDKELHETGHPTNIFH
ncbi:hypothetical protein PENTCL1PPCAC_788, partial [Pristionchus entomophagus]